MLQTIIRFFSRKKSVDNVAANSDVLEHAFTIEGVSFYKYKDDFSIAADRALSAMDIYEEVNQRIDREYLKTYFQTVVELLDKGKLVDASVLTKMAQSRLDHITNAQLLLKLASVIYIAEWENPKRYSLEDADKKIAFWMEHQNAIDFFGNEPIKKFIPYSKYLEENTMDYLKAQNNEIEKQLIGHFKMLSEQSENNDLKTSLKSQLKQTKALAKWLK